MTHMNAASSIPVVTIDGPSGSGKGTVAQALASELGWHYLDSGSLYRLLACAALRDRVGLENGPGLAGLARQLGKRCRLATAHDPALLLDGADVRDELRTEAAGAAASRIAALPEVRQALLDWQRRCRLSPGLVTDGRDMGTVVFPDATLKVFLTANPRVRAERRYNQLIDMGKDADLDELIKAVEARDARDSERAAAPLQPAQDALIIDNSGQSVATTLAVVLGAVREKL